MKEYFNTFLAPSKNRKCIRPPEHVKELLNLDARKETAEKAIGRLEHAIRTARKKIVNYQVNRGTKRHGFATLNLNDACKLLSKRILDIAYEIQRTEKWK